jgi:hypothetical protein
MTRSRKLAEIAAAYTAGNPLSFRNKIINGNAIAAQRGVVNVTSIVPAYGTDRMLSGVVAGTGINVNLSKGGFGGSSSGYGHYIAGSFTNGTPYWCQRIEAQNCQDLNNSWVTVSGILYQDSGSTLNFQPRLSKANASDNFSGGVTVLSTGSNVAVPTGVATPFAMRVQLGSADATNGLMFEIYLAGTATVTSKNFILTDLQLEKGVIQTMFENRFVGAELALCQRYLPAFNGAFPFAGSAFSASTTLAYSSIAFPVQTRVPATGVSVSSAGHFRYNNGSNNYIASAVSFIAAGDKAGWVSLTTSGIASGNLPGQVDSNNASGQLLFTGCEL